MTNKGELLELDVSTLLLPPDTAAAYRSGLEGREWSREAVRARDGWMCRRCFKKWKPGERRFDIHHLNGCGKFSRSYDRIADSPNLITLCHKCHLSLDSVKKKMKNWSSPRPDKPRLDKSIPLAKLKWSNKNHYTVMLTPEDIRYIIENYGSKGPTSIAKELAEKGRPISKQRISQIATRARAHGIDVPRFRIHSVVKKTLDTIVDEIASERDAA